jgi:hypothetical protein
VHHEFTVALPILEHTLGNAAILVYKGDFSVPDTLFSDAH